MRMHALICGCLVVSASVAGPVADEMTSPALGDVRLKGVPAEKMNDLFRARITSAFAQRNVFGEARRAFVERDDDERGAGGLWRGEFWGKLMLGAARVADYLRDPALTKFIDEECRNVSATLAVKWRNGLLDRLQAQLAAGVKTISVPKGRYFLRPAGGSVTYLQLTGLTDVTVDFNGSELIGEVKTAMLGLDACTNVTVRNVVIDYASLPFTQAVIEKTDADGTWDVRVIDGYPCPDEKEVGSAQAFWPVQAYDKDTLELKNPLRFRDGIAIAKTGPSTYRISGGYNRVGDVGDVAVWSIREMDRPVRRGAVCVKCCKNCLFENVIVYSTPHGCAYVEGGADGDVYRNCKVVRRPPETDLTKRGMKRLRSGNHDAFNSRCSYKGPTLENCEFKYHCDDCVNISGYYAFVTEQKGRTLRIAPFCSDLRISPGDSCQLMTYEGQCPPDATALTIVPDGETTAEERQLLKDLNLWESIGETVRKTFKVELDREVTLPPGSVIISNRRMGNGFVIRNCDMGHNRARGLLIKASDGLIESNRLTRTECTGIEISPEYEWMEGGCSRNLVIRGNVLTGNGGGISIAGNNGARKPLPVDAHSNVAIVGNAIRGSAHGITVVGCKGLDLRDNAFELTDAKIRPVKLVNVARVDEAFSCSGSCE